MTATTAQNPSPEPPSFDTRAAVLARLEADSHYYRPEYFAIYGIANAIPGLVPERTFIGWGMDFGGDYGAIFWCPPERATHMSQSAEQILRSHQRNAEAHLIWLE